MIDVLRDEPATRRIAVLGEMLELGPWADTLHRDVGAYAAEGGNRRGCRHSGAARPRRGGETSGNPGRRSDISSMNLSSAGDFLREFVRLGDADSL